MPCRSNCTENEAASATTMVLESSRRRARLLSRRLFRRQAPHACEKNTRIQFGERPCGVRRSCRRLYGVMRKTCLIRSLSSRTRHPESGSKTPALQNDSLSAHCVEVIRNDELVARKIHYCFEESRVGLPFKPSSRTPPVLRGDAHYIVLDCILVNAAQSCEIRALEGYVGLPY